MGRRTTDLNDILRKSHIDEITKCRLWDGYLDKDGYGRVSYKDKSVIVTRLVMHFSCGFDLNSRLEILHSCNNPKCINIEHLRPGTHQENVQDSVLAGTHKEVQKMYCPQGHEYTPENTYRTANGYRICKECTRIKNRSKTPELIKFYNDRRKLRVPSGY